MKKKHQKKILLAITGASGFIYAVKMIQLLKDSNVEVHLIVSKPAEQTRSLETNYTSSEIKQMADHVYSNQDISACVASGSYIIDAMIVLPCSAKTLAEVSHGLASSLISRVADVMLKERRKLILAVRETPLNRIHIQNMLNVTDAGGIIMPPLPAFYIKPKDIDELIYDTVARIADMAEIHVANIKRWK
jgi:flavin prenyltransferase